MERLMLQWVRVRGCVCVYGWRRRRRCWVGERAFSVTPPGLDTAGSRDQHFMRVMTLVPSPVVVVTTSDGNQKRGVTCSSFTDVSHQPPIISFCMKKPSRMHNLLMETRNFAVHLLSQAQVEFSVHFSRPVKENLDQFSSIPHQLSEKNVPILPGCCAVMHCEAHDVHTIGDHSVWYGKVQHSEIEPKLAPLLYYARSYRSIGDDVFMTAFETATLGYEEWTHEAHLRMAWNYITTYGKQEATPLIKTGIQHYIDMNVGKVKNVYNETMTLFFIHMVDQAIEKFGGRSHSFEEFLSLSPHLTDARLLSQYYSPGRIESKDAHQRWLEPDLQQLPGH